MTSPAASVITRPPVIATPDTPGPWRHSFPSAEMVDAAASMFTGHRIPDRELTVTLGPRPPRERVPHVWTVEAAQEVRDHLRRRGMPVADLESYGLELEPGLWDQARPAPRVFPRLTPTATVMELVEGPRWRIMVSPGTVSVRRQDPVRAERAHERQVLARDGRQGNRTPLVREPSDQPARITKWSSKSRARMVETIESLDWTPLLEGGRVPAMLTLTLPGDWLAVAPDAGAARRFLELFRRRYARAWGEPLRGVWKREFQDRTRRCPSCRSGEHDHPDSGRAPHWHLLVVPPHGVSRKGRGAPAESFLPWLSRTWAECVGAASCIDNGLRHDDEAEGGCCERRRHERAGTRVDFAKGAAATDPRRIASYFLKHGQFGAKDYQNEAPEEWFETGGVGRFWGVWGLDVARAGVIVDDPDARAAARTLRRWSRANAPLVDQPMWRYRTNVDPESGEVTARWRRSRKRRRLFYLRGEAGFVHAKDGPALAAQLARHVDQLRGRGTSAVGPSGAGPRGFLP